ncbi:MAG: HAD family hydrolase [Candidatus Omnitrophica bacterium]|nr:HAD family hydrolase [Candidatus Omnitrophota bacterium]
MAIKHIKLIIFDLDGTIVNAYDAITKSFNFTMRQLGLASLNAEVIRRAVGWGDRNLLKPFVPKQLLDKALRIYRKHHAKSLLKYSRLMPGARTLLLFLKKRGYQLAVASNRPTKFSLLVLKHLKIKKFFVSVLCADKVVLPKPYPDILLGLIKKLKVSADQTLYIADMVIDVEAGKNAGIRTIIVSTGSSSVREIRRKKPWKIFSSLFEIKKFLLRFEKQKVDLA